MLTLEIIDEKWAPRELEAQLRRFDGQAAYAGLFDPEQATKGFRHEVGEGVPERPWLAPSADAETEQALRVAALEIGDSLEGDQSPEDALEIVGEVFEDGARYYVEAGRVGGPPLSAQAKRNDPRKLIDTGDMIAALETRVAKSIPGEDA